MCQFHESLDATAERERDMNPCMSSFLRLNVLVQSWDVPKLQCLIVWRLTLSPGSSSTERLKTLWNNACPVQITPAVLSVQETILSIIHTAFGTIDLFNDSVRKIMRRIAGLSTDRHLGCMSCGGFRTVGQRVEWNEGGRRRGETGDHEGWLRNPNYLRIFFVFCFLLSSAFPLSSAFRLLCFFACLLLSLSASLASLLFCFSAAASLIVFLKFLFAALPCVSIFLLLFF